MVSAVSLERRVRRNVGLSLLNTVISRLATFLLGVALARILAPEQFGMYAAAFGVQLLLLYMNELGVGGAIVRRKGSIAGMLPTAWTLSVGGGLVCMLAAIIGAPGLAWIFGSPESTPLIQLMSLNVLLNGVASVPAATLVRELQQGRRLLVDMAGLVVNLTVTASLAMVGAGAWSLAVGSVCGASLVVLLLLVVTRSLPRFGFDRQYAGEIAGVGITMVTSSVLLVCLNLVPQAVTGHFIGVAALGLFFIASNVANWPVSILSVTLERVALSSFSRIRDSGGNPGGSAGAALALAGGSVLIVGVTLGVLAEPLLGLVYGEAWVPAAAVLGGLALANVARIVGELVFNLLLAANSAVYAVWSQTAWLVVLVPASIGGARLGGFEGIAWAQAAVAFAWAIPIQLLISRKAGVSLVGVATSFAPVGCIAGGCGLALLLVRMMELDAPVTLLAGSAIAGVGLLLVYLKFRSTVLVG